MTDPTSTTPAGVDTRHEDFNEDFYEATGIVLGDAGVNLALAAGWKTPTQHDAEVQAERDAANARVEAAVKQAVNRERARWAFRVGFDYVPTGERVEVAFNTLSAAQHFVTMARTSAETVDIMVGLSTPEFTELTSLDSRESVDVREFLAALQPPPTMPAVPSVDAAVASVTEDQIDHMVRRFLMWRLPGDFAPDNGVTFTPHPNGPTYSWPVGTNLLTFEQAKAMVLHIFETAAIRARSVALPDAKESGA